MTRLSPNTTTDNGPPTIHNVPEKVAKLSTDFKRLAPRLRMESTKFVISCSMRCPILSMKREKRANVKYFFSLPNNSAIIFLDNQVRHKIANFPRRYFFKIEAAT